MSMMVCLALFMGVQVFPPPIFDLQPNLSYHLAGEYIEETETAIIYENILLIRAHEATHHLQYKNGLPYNEEQAWAAAYNYLIYCRGGEQ